MGFEYFIRTVPDSFPPRIPETFILVFIAALVLTARYVKTPRLFAVLGICLQLAVLTWFAYAGTLVTDGLPLYHCRISLWVISIGILFGIRSKFIVWISMLGITSSLLVLLMRDMDPFAYPHITNFYYFLGHGIIFLIAVSYLDFYYVRLKIAEIGLYTLGLHILIYFADAVLGANYAYLMKLPLINVYVFNRFSFLIVTLLIIAIVSTTKTVLETTAVADILRINSRVNRLRRINKRKKLRKNSGSSQ